MSDYYNIIDSAEKRAREEGLLQGRLQGREEGLAEGLEEGIAKGLEEGLAKGVVEGREKERKEVVQKLLASGMSTESIADILQIPEDILQQML